VNGSEIEREVSESSALFPAVREQLSVDSCARKCFVNWNEMERADIDSLEILLSGEKISKLGSQLLLSNVFGNDNLERLFLNCSKSEIEMNLSELMIDRRIEIESADISNLSVEVLGSLLVRESISVESEDALLRHILKLGPGYRDLLRHIEISFLSEDGLSLLDEHLRIPSESVSHWAVERISHPPPFDSQIISHFPEIFAEFGRKQFSLLWRGGRNGFGASEFHR
jgi:hypothetical protein